jgi:chemotaxis protein CheX
MHTVHLPEILDLRAASPLATELLAARGQQLTIDGANVQKVGAQCIQVLLSAKATWLADGLYIAVSNPSETLLEALETLGITVAEISEQESPR